MFEKIFNDVWPLLKKQGLFVLTLLSIIYYFNGRVNDLELKVDNCNRQNTEEFLQLQRQTLNILDRLDLKIDMIANKNMGKVYEKKYNYSPSAGFAYSDSSVYGK